MYTRNPSAPAAETINCGCLAIPFMEGWRNDKVLKNPRCSPSNPLLADSESESVSDAWAPQTATSQ